ncbi:hypothetical protein D9M73_276120 [compost metagenome]
MSKSDARRNSCFCRSSGMVPPNGLLKRVVSTSALIDHWLAANCSASRLMPVDGSLGISMTLRPRRSANCNKP